MNLKELRKLKKSTQPVKDDILEELEELKEETLPASGFANVPTISVNENDLIKIKFLAEPIEKTLKDNKEIAYADCEVIQDHAGYDREKREEIPLRKGDKASINLKRHKILWQQYLNHKPVKDKSFIIGIVGTLPTKKGKPAKDYRWKEIA